VAYESIPKAWRARWHADLAEWIVRTIGERDEVAPILAHHLAAAAGPEAAELAWVDEPDRLHALRQDAVRWLRRAGELAMHRYELDDAAGMFRQAVDLEPERDVEVELWRLLGRAAALRYDGVGLWDAMERAVERCEDPRVLGELYAELALQTTDRPGMWTRFPDHDRVQGWIDRALELTEPGTHARCRAVIALCYWQQDRPAWALEEAEELSERLGDPALRIGALETRSFAEFAAGAYEAALDSALRAVDLERRHASDPDTGERLREEMASLFVMCGRLAEARELIEEHAEVSRKLFPHHRLHSVSLELELHEVLGEWEEIRAMVPRVRDAVRENAATPCVRGPRSLLVCAAASAAADDEERVELLEREARELHVAGFGWIVDAPLIRLALHRHDLAEARRLIAESDFPITRRQTWYFTAAVAAHFDALIALGDRERVDRDAAEFLGTNTVLTAFATRALGSVRDDQVLLAEAATSFERYGFEDQAAKTRARS
jgi:tetratricopeptide (TPR) repeat protein